MAEDRRDPPLLPGTARRVGGGGAGQRDSPPTVFRPPRPLPTPTPISLQAPRPETERARNLYLGAPLQGPSKDTSFTAAEQVRLPTSKKGGKDQGLPVTSQPKGGKTKRLLSGGDLEEESVEKLSLPQSSILCPYCRRCRCEACSTPRALPTRWVCRDSVPCGPEPCLDYLTCLCCVKALFYHCGKDHEPDGGVTCADKPCSCAPHRKFWRWGAMGAMSFLMPCLCLYWPCKGVLRLTEKAYQAYHANGCTCPRRPEPEREREGREKGSGLGVGVGTTFLPTRKQ